MNVFRVYSLTFFLCLVGIYFGGCECKPATPFRSDTIVTKYGSIDDDSEKPGWLRTQLRKFGEMASKVGNAMGKHAVKVTSAVDKICEIVKTVIPLLAAVCHVGQFKFCAATEAAPLNIENAINANPIDLNIPD